MYMYILNCCLIVVFNVIFFFRFNLDGYGVVLYCLDFGIVEYIMVENFDGQNWE